jgi:hypothetical protein
MAGAGESETIKSFGNLRLESRHEPAADKLLDTSGAGEIFDGELAAVCGL